MISLSRVDDALVIPGLRLGNTKLGRVHTFTLPVSETCPGETDVCGFHCYAKKGRMLGGPVIRLARANYRLSRRPVIFQQVITADIYRYQVERLRIHPAGDFYAPRYVASWADILRRHRQVSAWAYTRSWRKAKSRMRDALELLAEQPNMELWLSCDRDSGEPTEMPGTRRAYMAVDDNDYPPYRVDLRFRVRRQSVMKFDQQGTWVCPSENGINLAVPMTCSRCQLCFSSRAAPQKLVSITPA